MRAIGGFRPHKVSNSAPDAEDIAWIDASCVFEHTDRVSSDRPPVGTQVTLAGYPDAAFSTEDFASSSNPPPCVLQGTVIEEPVGLAASAPGIIWIEIPGVWSGFMPGFSGGPCAYRDENGQWVVFGVAQLSLGDKVWELLGIDLPIRAGKRHAIVAIAPIPKGWVE